ncbi:hypothetical protein PhCBS80983_g05666 [Powellomyces hirtus]|uniref:NADH:ubiquinone oxidoreductase intermediate-associated protein 30 domain-containing protein n=1 Tax=Powellomyces hirtus TaxID=109895 RepID=A0A507DUI9_9FUNG|nr:hypothetical protein PhCBS80983_g05666 [Powellomyces hirtus]
MLAFLFVVLQFAQAARSAAFPKQAILSQGSRDIFGGDVGWDIRLWEAVDDRVRGGKSHSKLSPSADGGVRFSGNLDITTLGGAGFASQRTRNDIKKRWDLTSFTGLEIATASNTVGKKYSLNLYTDAEQAGYPYSRVNWKYSFTPGKEAEVAEPDWSDFKPYYRGKEVEGGPPLDVGSVSSWSLMCQSYFGDQEGDFGVDVMRITAVQR